MHVAREERCSVIDAGASEAVSQAPSWPHAANPAELANPARRRAALGAIAAAGLAAAPALRAQEAFPSRPIRLVVPFAAGGISDIMARVVGKALSEQLGQPVNVDNRPGGGTVIGTQEAVRAKPDGYTILLVSAPIATNPGLFPRLPYDAMKDLAPLIALSAQGFAISVGEKQPWRSFAELMEAARKPGAEIPYASPGIGTLMHLSMQLANVEYGTRFVHVPYKGTGPALQDAISGVVPMIVDPASTSQGPIRQGRLRGLAVTHPTRLSALPDVPTVRELGFPRLEAVAFAGLMLPAGVPPEIAAKLNAELNRALQNAEVRDKLVVQLGQTLIGGPAEDFGRMVRTETERWSPLVRKLGITAE
jgi:tripartite-type tricarboxylate transporter receptor subunit TctC